MPPDNRNSLLTVPGTDTAKGAKRVDSRTGRRLKVLSVNRLIRHIFVLALIFAVVAIAVPASAKRYVVKRNPDGTVKIVDPNETVLSRVVKLPVRMVRTIVPGFGRADGFGKPIRQKDMEQAPTIPAAAGNAIEQISSPLRRLIQPVENTILAPISAVRRSIMKSGNR
jgi:hypothetical protein